MNTLITCIGAFDIDTITSLSVVLSIHIWKNLEIMLSLFRSIGTFTRASLYGNGVGSELQIRAFSKFLSKSARKRLPLTTKRAKKGYVKGKGCTVEGRHLKNGRYVVDPKKMLKLIVPDLTDFKLKPYIAASVPKIPPGARKKVV